MFCLQATCWKLQSLSYQFTPPNPVTFAQAPPTHTSVYLLSKPHLISCREKHTLTHANSAETCPNPKPGSLYLIHSTEIRVNQRITLQNQKYMSYWKSQPRAQSKMRCYLAQKQRHTGAHELSTVTEIKYGLRWTERRKNGSLLSRDVLN